MTGSKTSDSHGGESACTLTARVIAELVGGELRGDANTEIDSVAPLSRAKRRQLSFLADRRYATALEASQAGVILVSPDLADAPGDVPARIVVAKPPAAMLEVLARLYPRSDYLPGVHPTARIGMGASLGKNVRLDEYAVVGRGAAIGDGVWIGAHCAIGEGVPIGADCRLFPHVTVYSGTTLGARVILHSGVRVGSDGFGYVSTPTDHSKIPHVGRCIVADDVEIGANTTIDRGSIDDTVIGAGTKIDNLVQVGHNVQIGRLCLIMAQVGIAGSTRIGDGCVIAGQAGIGGHLFIGSGARIGGQSGVFGNIPAGEVWSGYPARPHRESLRATGALFKIAGMLKRIESLLAEKDRR